MTVTVPVSISPEERAALVARANTEGVTVDSLLRKAVLQIIGTATGTAPDEQLSAAEFERAFEEMAAEIPDDVPSLPDEALDRESIYTR
jgi:hypothetical protein